MKLTSDELRALAELPPETLPNVLRMMADACEADDNRRARDADRKRKIRGMSVESPRKVRGKSQENPRTFPGKSTELVSPKKINKTPSPRDFIQEAKISRKRLPKIADPPACRLPADWNPSEELWQKAKRKFAMDDDALRWETTKFRDYWHAKPKDACKVDWDAAWRNWMQRACENHHKATNGRGPGPPHETLVQTADRVGKAMMEWDKRHEGYSGSIFSGLFDQGTSDKVREDDGE